MNGTLKLDGVSQWSAIVGLSKKSPRDEVVLGNATDLCSEDKKHCGFGIRVGDFKILRDYGGSPDWRCNTTAKGDKVECDTNNPWTQNLTSCPNGWCLFDVISDPHEMNEISSKYPQKLAQLQSRLEEVLTTFRSFEIDPNCPTPQFQNDSKVGKTWGPWC